MKDDLMSRRVGYGGGSWVLRLGVAAVRECNVSDVSTDGYQRPARPRR